MKYHFLVTLAILVAALAVAASCNSNDDDDDDSSSSDDTSAPDDDSIADDGGDDDAADRPDPETECEEIEDPSSNEACRMCVLQCDLALESSIDLGDGPCLSESITPGWVCDVVHAPHTSEDDLLENQCVQWPSISPHKVEVSTICHFISLG